MGAFIKLCGIGCLLGIVAYWFFLPYQAYLGLVGAGSLLGPIIANLAALVLLTIIGIPVTWVLLATGFVLLAED